MYYGIKSGSFGRAGLSVEQIAIGSGAAATTAVIAGTYELAYTSLLAVINAHMRGIGIVVVAAANLHLARDPLALLQMSAESKLRTGSDLEGKVVGVPALDDLNSISVRAWVDRNRGNWRDLKFIEIPNSALEATIQQHRVDVAVMQSPQLFTSIAAGTSKTLGDSWSAIAPRFLAGLYVARADWVAQNKDLIRRFVAAYTDATVYTGAHSAETAQYAADLTKIDLSVVQKMHRTNYATALDPADLQPVIDAAGKYGVIARSFPAREIMASL